MTRSMSGQARALLTCIVIGVTVPTAVHADFVISVGAGTNTSPAGNGNLVTSSFAGSSQNNDFTGTGASNPNQVSLQLDAFTLQQPFTINVTTSNFGTPTGPGAEYFFTVTMKNRLGDNGVQPSAAGEVIGPVSVRILGAASGSGATTVAATFDSPANPTPTSSPFSYWYNPSYQTPTSLLFGGATGSGGEIPYGSTETFTFSIDVPQTSAPFGQFTLEFTANPEPGSLILAGVLGVPALAFWRRRKRATVANAEPTLSEA